MSPCALARLGKGRMLVVRLEGGSGDSANYRDDRQDRRSCKPATNHHRTG